MDSGSYIAFSSLEWLKYTNSQLNIEMLILNLRSGKYYRNIFSKMYAFFYEKKYHDPNISMLEGWHLNFEQISSIFSITTIIMTKNSKTFNAKMKAFNFLASIILVKILEFIQDGSLRLCSCGILVSHIKFLLKIRIVLLYSSLL